MIEKNGKTINSVEEWGIVAGPKEKVHWKDHRSAKEAAKAWFLNDKPSVPAELIQIFENSGHFNDLNVVKVEPEALLNFDSFSGPSNMDLLAHAKDGKGEFVIGIEAKADEPFSECVKDKFVVALEAKFDSPNSKRIKRIEQLSLALFSKKRNNSPRVGELRYQLLTGLAGTIAEAVNKNLDRAVFLIHEFNTPLTTSEKHEQNQIDLNNFMHRLSNGEIKKVDAGKLYGPFKIPGKPLFDDIPDIYVGKISRIIK